MKAQGPVINFHFQKVCTLKERIRLKVFIVAVLKRYKIKADSINVIFCSDEYLLEINRQYLQHDYFTDIITFDLAAKGTAVNGEIYISIDRVKENARTLGVSFNNELHRVIFHGVLHLCGLKDNRESDKKVMRREEDKLLSRYFR